jgi:predicted RNA-binding Zn ribbon-like protein
MSSATYTGAMSSTAPAGPRLVLDFLNTDRGGRPDPLADTAGAQRWFAGVAPEAPSASFTDRDLRHLAELRTQLRQALRRGDPAPGWIVPAGVSAGLRQAADGTVLASPQGSGWKLVASMLLIETWTAQTAELWPRLKVCKNDACGGAFYDRSRNNSGVWHDVLVCGNAINLRTSRARRRAAAGAVSDAGD